MPPPAPAGITTLPLSDNCKAITSIQSYNQNSLKGGRKTKNYIQNTENTQKSIDKYGKLDKINLQTPPRRMQNELNIKTYNEKESYWLLWACCSSREESALKALDRGASPKSKRSDGVTALHLACANNMLRLAEKLIELGADVDAQDVQGSTPLHFAAKMNRKDAVKLLLRNKSKVDLKANDGSTPLLVASFLGNASAALELIKHAEINLKNNSGRNALHYAANYGKVSVVKALLKRGANANEKDYYGRTPDFYSCDSKISSLIKNAQNNQKG